MNQQATAAQAGGIGLDPGLYDDIPMHTYLEIDALGSTRMEWIGISPLHYRHLLSKPPKGTDATDLGTAVHMAVLQPKLFKQAYALEPSPEQVAPDAAKPRATKAYKDAVAALEDNGRIVLKTDEMEKVIGMAAAVLAHPHAKALLDRCPGREVTAIWEIDGRTCRGRLDMIGDGVIADLKTTRRLKDFSPWTITKMGYYRQQGFYRDGLDRLGRKVKHAFLVAVENTAPHDVGVFVLDDAVLEIGMSECERLIARLGQCERMDRWPGMFPDIQNAELKDAIALQLPDLDEEGE